MEARLNKNSIPCHKKIYETCIIREETAESVVPDTQPDIAEIIHAQGLVLLRSKDVEQGRISVSGNINATVLYCPENESGVRKLCLTIPFSASAESAVLNERVKPVVTAKLCCIDARMLNPRKVLLRAEVRIDVKAYEESCIDVYDTNGADVACDVQVLSSRCRISPVTGVREKTFVISEECQVPAAKPPVGEILMQEVELSVDDLKTVGNKLIFKGNADIHITYEGVENSELSSTNFTAPFSQILELDCAVEQADAEVHLMPTGVYLEPLPIAQDDRMLGVEIHVVAQAVCSENMEIEFIEDAYSNTFELKLDQAEIDLNTVENRTTLRETVRETVETETPVRELIHAYAIPGNPEVQDVKVICPITIYALYMNEDNKIASTTKTVTAESTLEHDAGTAIGINDVRCMEIFASPASEGVEVRIPLDLDLVFMDNFKIAPIVAIEVDEEAPVDIATKPSVTIVNGCNCDNLWKVAKQYASTPELIVSANQLEEGTVPELILIPRAR